MLRFVHCVVNPSGLARGAGGHNISMSSVSRGRDPTARGCVCRRRRMRCLITDIHSLHLCDSSLLAWPRRLLASCCVLMPHRHHATDRRARLLSRPSKVRRLVFSSCLLPLIASADHYNRTYCSHSHHPTLLSLAWCG